MKISGKWRPFCIDLNVLTEIKAPDKRPAGPGPIASLGLEYVILTIKPSIYINARDVNYCHLEFATAQVWKVTELVPVVTDMIFDKYGSRNKIKYGLFVTVCDFSRK